jgi:predicted glycosyltransferase
MNSSKNTRILLAPLDWGLGHATRCVPLIRYLLQKGCEVVLATDGPSAQLLTAEFPGISIRKLEGYGIRYNAGSSLFVSMLLQLPRIFRRIQKEHQWLNELVQNERIDVVISDNRPGLWNRKTHCIYITHQLLIHSGKGKWLNRLLQKLHARYMKRFSATWVPDLQGTNYLAGELSHPSQPIVQPTYLGLLSRFEKQEGTEQEYDLMVLLSGPEPQRTILEEKILHQLQTYPGKVLLVRGLPHQNNSALQPHQRITVHNHLPAGALQKAICSSKLIICRSGYTTLMDLTRLEKKAFLIPTPGQPEQEYLAQYMQEQAYFPFQKQDLFDLSAVMQIAASFPYQQAFTASDFEGYKIVLDELLKNKTLH